MSSRVFKAKTAHSKEKPQICGLSNREIAKDDPIMYLVCNGVDARPEYQIKVTREEKTTKKFRGRERTVYEKDYGMDDGRVFRSVFGGWHVNPDTNKREKSFEWQECKGKDANGNAIWVPVECWSHIALAEVADRLGYEVRKNGKGKWSTTTAREGDRAIGNEHSVSSEEPNAMEVLARAACTDEELGLVPPSKVEDSVEEILEILDGKAEIVEQDKAEQSFDQDAEDAEALGMSLENYRKLQSGYVR